MEASIDQETNQAVIALVMRPKTDKIKSDTEAAELSYEGWKEALYERADEQPGYIAVLNKRPLATTALVYNAKDSVKINPKKIKLSSSEVIIGADVTFEVTDYRLPKGITKTNGNADKSNIRWCLHIQGVHAKGAYSIIKNGTTVESETDFTTNATQADLDSKSYLYADAEIDGSSNKLTIQFSKHLAGKKVQIEAFRETPSIIQPPNLGTIKSVTIKAKEKATLIQKLTSDLFISAECCDGDEGDLSFIDKKKTVKLTAECFCGRDFKVKDIKNIVKKLRDEEVEVLKRYGYGLFSGKNCKIPRSDKTYEKFTDALNKTFTKYNINTCIRKIHFLAQAYTESAYFSTTQENGSLTYLKGKYYYPYIGRGLLQLTHGGNKLGEIGYKQYFAYIGRDDFATKYDLLNKDLEYAIDVSGYFWARGKLLNKGNFLRSKYPNSQGNKINYPKKKMKGYTTVDLNEIADDDNIKQLTYLVNGTGMYHLKERTEYSKQLKKIFNYEQICHNYE